MALSGIIQAKPREASLENLLCEMVVTKVGPAAVFPSKLSAIAQLAKICGWNESEKHEHCASNELTKLLKRLRGSKRALGLEHLDYRSGTHRKWKFKDAPVT